MKFRAIIQYVALFFLLGVLPAGSWYYLNKGMNYRLATRAELGDYGLFPSGLFRETDATALEAGELSGKVLVAYRFAAPFGEETNLVAGELSKIHEQFNEREDVLFLFSGTPQDSAELSALLRKYRLTDFPQIRSLLIDPEQLQDSFFTQNKESSLVALADTSGTVRQFYDCRDGKRVKRLVEHIALLIPVIEKEKPVLKREREK